MSSMIETLNDRGLVLVGCGQMGGAMLHGWIEAGVAPSSVHILDPMLSEEIKALGVKSTGALPASPAVCVLAVKPQIMEAALPQIFHYAHGETMMLSIAAGKTLGFFEAHLGADTPIIRSMPNLPAFIRKGVTAMIGNAACTGTQLDLAEFLLSSIGFSLRLTDESQMDAVTALSGSGPGFIFHLIECMAAAGEAEGLPAEISLNLARATVAGAGQMAHQLRADPAKLRESVTSKGGTTKAGLDVLMQEAEGLMARTIAAAAQRSRELAQ